MRPEASKTITVYLGDLCVIRFMLGFFVVVDILHEFNSHFRVHGCSFCLLMLGTLSFVRFSLVSIGG